MPTYTPSNTPYQARNLNEMLVPLAKYAEVAGEYEKQTDDYLNRLATLRAFMPDDDVEMAKTLKEAEDAYNDAWGRIQSNGLSLNDKNSYRTAHALYRDKVVPYHAAMEAREAVRKAHEANMANRDVRYQTGKGPNDYNISAYLHGNRPEIAFVQGENVAKEAHDMMQAIQSGQYTRGDVTYSLTKKGIYGLQKEIDTFLAAMNSGDYEKASRIGNEYVHGKKNDPNANGPLWEIYRQLQDKYGINGNNFNEEAQSYLNNQIILGMKRAGDGVDIYESKVPKTDYNGIGPGLRPPTPDIKTDWIDYGDDFSMKTFSSNGIGMAKPKGGTGTVPALLVNGKPTIPLQNFLKKDKDGKVVMMNMDEIRRRIAEYDDVTTGVKSYTGEYTLKQYTHKNASSSGPVKDKFVNEIYNALNHTFSIYGDKIENEVDFNAFMSLGMTGDAKNYEQTRAYMSKAKEFTNGISHVSSIDIQSDDGYTFDPGQKVVVFLSPDRKIHFMQESKQTKYGKTQITGTHYGVLKNPDKFGIKQSTIDNVMEDYTEYPIAYREYMKKQNCYDEIINALSRRTEKEIDDEEYANEVKRILRKYNLKKDDIMPDNLAKEASGLAVLQQSIGAEYNSLLDLITRTFAGTTTKQNTAELEKNKVTSYSSDPYEIFQDQN